MFSYNCACLPSVTSSKTFFLSHELKPSCGSVLVLRSTLFFPCRLAQLFDINWSDMSDISIKYVDDYFSLVFTQCRTKVTLSYSACCATRCSAMKPSKLKRHLDGKHPEHKEEDMSFVQRKESPKPNRKLRDLLMSCMLQQQISH